jgi:hypothetical protein
LVERVLVGGVAAEIPVSMESQSLGRDGDDVAWRICNEITLSVSL